MAADGSQAPTTVVVQEPVAPPPAVAAMHSLALEMRNACRAPQLTLLATQVRLRAAADQLISAESSEQRRNEVLLGCQAYLELMLRPVPSGASTDGGALHDWLQQRSDRYLKLVGESSCRVVAHGSSLLGSLLRGASGRSASLDECIAPPARERNSSSIAMPASFESLSIGSLATLPGSLATALPGGLPGAASGAVSCVLTHGYCPHVTELLLRTAAQAHFTLVVSEGRPDGDGHRTASELMQAGVPVRIIEPGAVARCMAQCRLVLCGAHAVLGDGGVLAPVGTLTMAYAAQAHGRPFYAVAAHYAFSSTHHVDAAAQTRARARPAPMPPRSTSSAAAGGVSASGSATAIMLEEPRRDATPPHLITLLITDVGVLTPSAVAEEMLRRGPV